MQELNEPGDRKLVKKRPVGLLVAFAVGGIVLMAIIMYYSRSMSSMDYNYTLMISAKALNLSCPDTVSETTRLDSVTAKRDRLFTYYFTFLKLKKDELDSTYCADWRESIRNTTMQTSQEFANEGVTVIYKTRDKYGADLCEVILLPEDYIVHPK